MENFDAILDFKHGSRERLGVAPGEMMLLFVGQHIREKGDSANAQAQTVQYAFYAI